MKRIFVMLIMLAACLAVRADQAPAGVRAAMNKLMPGIDPQWVKRAPMPGFYEVVYGPHLFYISNDGRYLLRGDVLELDGNRNLTRPERKKARVAAIESLGEGTMIVYEPKHALHTVTIFTDVDCPYCQKLHAELQSYLDLGIRVRYLAFPRAGIPSDNYDRMVSVWCAADRQKALTDAKAMLSVAPAKCENPIANHYQMGRMVGVRGTPTIVLDSGDIVPGYMPAAGLNNALKQAGIEG